MTGASTCYVHSFGHFRGVPWYKNVTIQFAISIILSLAYIAYTEITKPSMDDFIQAMKEADLESSASLLSRYPSGYILFGIYGDEFVESHANKLSDEYKINWKSAKVLEVNERSIKLQFPDIEMGPYKFSGNEWTLGRGKGPGRTMLPIGILPEIIWVEVLRETDEGSIVVLGFEPDARWK